jgi:ribonucleoside-diphosphate reductase beta chain
MQQFIRERVIKLRGLLNITDESLHSIGGAELCKDVIAESNYTPEQYKEFEENVYKACHKIYDHESRIVDMLFEKGKMEGITDTQMKHFVQSRINVCLEQLNLKKLYDVKYNPIGEWFYKGINDFQFNDFFSGIGREYQRDWDESSFTWETK